MKNRFCFLLNRQLQCHFFLFKKEKQKKIVFAFVFVLLLNQQWECRFQYKI